MPPSTPSTMEAAVINRFGGIDEIEITTLPVPNVEPNEVLIQLESIGLGKWDTVERNGVYTGLFGEAAFPYVLGWEGAGTVAAVGDRVRRFSDGDRVYATTLPGPSGGGFYAEYATATEDSTSVIPQGLTNDQAAAMGWDALTALAGLDHVLSVKPDESLMIFGAGGGIGHIAVQLAKRMRARVLAVASGTDGVTFAQLLGADVAVDGRHDDIVGAARDFAPDGLDAALLTAGGETAERALSAVRANGRVAFPYGMMPEPTERDEPRIKRFNGSLGPEAHATLHQLIGSDPFNVHVSATFPFAKVADAHRKLEQHYLGKLALRMG